MGAAYQDLTARLPDNVTSGEWTISATDAAGYECGSTVQPIDLTSAGMISGRWVVIRAQYGLKNYVGATVTPPTGRTLIGVSREDVNFSGTTWDCIVVTLA